MIVDLDENFIELVDTDGDTIIINTDKIIAIFLCNHTYGQDEGKTCIGLIEDTKFFVDIPLNKFIFKTKSNKHMD